MGSFLSLMKAEFLRPFPTGQSSHCPVGLRSWSAVHDITQFAAPEFDSYPGAQSVHEVAIAPEYLPAIQPTHEVAELADCA